MSEHAGMGGSYVVNEAGEKVLVQRTDEPAGQSTNPPADGGQVAGQDHQHAQVTGDLPAPGHKKTKPAPLQVSEKQTDGGKA